MKRYLLLLVVIVILALILWFGFIGKDDKSVEPTVAPASAATAVIPTEAPASTLAPTPTRADSTFDSPLSPLPTPQ